MKSGIGRTLVSFFLPGGLLIMGVGIVVHLGLLPKSAATLAHVYLYAVGVAGVLLGWRFNRSRLVYALLLLILADRSLWYFGVRSPELARIIAEAAGLLLPFNLLVLSLVQERGILTGRGLWRLGLMVLQILLVVLLCRHQPAVFTDYLNYSFSEGGLVSRVSLAQPALVCFAIAFVFLLVRFFLRGGAMAGDFFWALVATFFALELSEAGSPSSTIYFATAGLILVVSVIETSHSMAFRDELTGLPARRALNEELLKLGNRYAVAMLDIDFFKKFNDRYGHEAGDQVLRMVASHLAGVGGGGKAFRYGGEEFTILFPGKLVDEVVPHLERLRKAVEAAGFIIRSRKRPRKKPENPKPIKGPRKRVTVTVSVGVAQRNEHHATPQQVVRAADKALYQAKRSGRNRVCSFGHR